MQEIILNLFCILVALFGLGVAVWALLSGTLATQGVDGLFLLAVCLTLAALFAWIPVRSLSRARLRDLLKRKKKTAAPDDSAKRASAPATVPREGA